MCMKATVKTKRLVAVISAVAVAALCGWLTWYVMMRFAALGGKPENFAEWIAGFGWQSRLVALGVQVLQVVIALLPGEVVEVGIGYCFGAVEGTALCLAGVAIGSALIFSLVKVFGLRLVDLFFDRDKIDRLRVINTEKKLKRTVFLVFFIPGTPKDLLTYFAGLTRIRLWEFLAISLVARIPSVVSSTAFGGLVENGNYLVAVSLYAVTGGISALGLWCYNRFLDKKQK